MLFKERLKGDTKRKGEKMKKETENSKNRSTAALTTARAHKGRGRRTKLREPNFLPVRDAHCGCERPAEGDKMVCSYPASPLLALLAT